jgi:hypothetical protein
LLTRGPDGMRLTPRATALSGADEDHAGADRGVGVARAGLRSGDGSANV